MEVTLNSPFALSALPELRDHFQDEILVGVGTVRNPTEAQLVVDAGAQFLVSPNLDLETVAFARASGLLHIPGVFTASEVQTAFAAGCRMLKLFPMEGLASGAAYLKALRAPFQDLDFVPTGGLSLENIADYARAGAVAIGMGSKLVNQRDQPSQELTLRAIALRKAWENAKYDTSPF
jgi:2-dehydro-3-deoxyphosphogluconate aldolase/(4S)-4-hydroxy-2-oxoglutarate aldolase